LYELNHEEMIKKDKTAYIYIAMTQFLYNFILIMDNVPYKVLKDCKLNFQNWYPFHRQFLDVLGIMLHKKKYLAHFKRTLDVSRERYNVNCGPLVNMFSESLTVNESKLLKAASPLESL